MDNGRFPPTILLMKIRSLDEVGIDAWNTTVSAVPGGTFFHLAEWESIIRRSFGFDSEYLAVEDASGIIGVLPLFVVNRGPFGTALISTPLCATGGVAAFSGEATEFLEKAMIARAKALRVDYVELRNSRRSLEGWHLHNQFISFTRPILESEEENFTAVPKRQRTYIRKAMALGLTASIVCDVEPFYSLYTESMHRLGTPAYPKKYISTLLSEFGDCAEIVVVNNRHRPISAALCFNFNGQILPYYGGASDAAYATNAATFMLWSIVKHAFECGCTMADFGRSIRGTGSFNFKKNWGMEWQPLQYQTRLINGRSHPIMDPASRRFRVFSNVWRNLPRGIVDRLSPLASRLVV